jgi:hypothetical protein
MADHSASRVLRGRPVANVASLSRSGLLSRLAYKQAQQMGLKVQDALRKAGLTVTEMEDQEARVAISNEIRFVRFITDRIADRNLDFRLAQAYDPREIGLLYYVAASADTLGEALLRVQRYQSDQFSTCIDWWRGN